LTACLGLPIGWMKFLFPKGFDTIFWPGLIPIAKNTLPIVPFDHFHWPFKILWNLPNPITHLTINFLKITIKKFRPPNPIISLFTTFFLHTYRQAYSTPFYIIVCTIILSYHLLPFRHLLYQIFLFFFFFFYLAIEKKFLKFLPLRWGKKCQEILHYLGTPLSFITGNQ